MPKNNILIVEDETIIGMDIASKLERNGYQVCGLAVDDIETTAYLEKCVPDLILMDISLKSSVDGIELVKNIHKTRLIPVIYLTSYSDSSTIKRSMETGPYGYIIKPFTTQTLLASVNLSFIRMELEKHLKEKNDMLTGIFDNTADGIAVLDADYKIKSCNRAFQNIFKISELNEQTYLRDVLCDLTIETGMHTMHNTQVGDTNKNLLISASSFENGHIITVSDLTELKSFETALNLAENRFTTVFKKKFIPAVIVECSNKTIYDYNDSFLALYKTGDVKGIPFANIIGSDVFSSLMELASESGTCTLSQTHQTAKDGSEFFAHIKCCRLLLDNRDFFLIDIEDISEKIKVEQMDKELKVQMIQTNKMTALGTLVSGVAHELNNPNNFIMFNSSLLFDYFNDIFTLLDKKAEKEPGLKVGNLAYEEVKNDVMQLMSGVLKGSERIRDIVLDLKGFARQDIPINKEHLDVSVALKSAIRILQHKINKSTDFFITKGLDAPVYICGNIQKLEQVFLNIIINALEALTSKSQAVTVSASSANGFAVIEVSDQGMGIPKSILDRITEPFFTTKQTTGGTGLGLAIVYSIIKDHNGSIEISSEEGKGSKIRILIPEEAKC